MPRPFEDATVSYADFLYNGSEGSGGILTGGVGQLVDGVKGTEALDTDEGRFAWVGWYPALQLTIFEFGNLQQFGSVTVHAYLRSPGVTWFGTVEVFISRNKAQWNTFSLETNGLQGPQDITIPTHTDSGDGVEGRYVRLIFSNIQGSGPMLISEVSFNSTDSEFLCSPTPSFRTVNVLLQPDPLLYSLAPSLCLSAYDHSRTCTQCTGYWPVGWSNWYNCSTDCSCHRCNPYCLLHL